MLVVNLAVSSEAFITTVHEIGVWLAQEDISSPYSTFSGDRTHRVIRLGFAMDREAQRFAKRFGGDILPPVDVNLAPVGDRHTA